MTSTELTTQAGAQPPATQIRETVKTIKARVQMVQHVMRDVMKQGEHYGTIPGTNKPTLFKPGAELIALAFQFAPRYSVDDLSDGDSIRYRITCELYSRETGLFIGSGQGEASSNEEKYRWRRAVCDEEFDETTEDRKRVKWFKGSGGGKAYNQKQVRTEPADIANTVLKMGEKRAFVDAIRTASGCSDMFSQDLEDLPAEIREGMEDAPPKPEPLGADGWAKLCAQAEGFGYAEADVKASAAAAGWEGKPDEMPRALAKQLYRTMRDNPASAEAEDAEIVEEEPAAKKKSRQTVRDEQAEVAPEEPDNVLPLRPEPATKKQLAEIAKAYKASGMYEAEFASIVESYGDFTAEGYGLTEETAGYVLEALNERAAQ